MKITKTTMFYTVIFIVGIFSVFLLTKKEKDARENIDVDLHKVEPDDAAWKEWLEYPTIEKLGLEVENTSFGYSKEDLYLRQSDAADYVISQYGEGIIDIFDNGRLLSDYMTEEEKEEMKKSIRISLDENALAGFYNYVNYIDGAINRVDEFTGFYDSINDGETFLSEDIGFSKVGNVYVGYPEGHAKFSIDSLASEEEKGVFELLILTYIDEDLTALKYKEIVEGLDITVNGVNALPGHDLLKKEKSLKEDLTYFEGEFLESELEASSLFHEFSHWQEPRPIKDFNILARTVITTKYQVLLSKSDVAKLVNGTSTEEFALKIGEYETKIAPRQIEHPIEFTKQKW